MPASEPLLRVSFNARRVLDQEPRPLLADQHRRGVRVPGRDPRHDRRVDHAEPLDAAHAEPAVDDCFGIPPHAARAHLVVVRRDRAADVVLELVVGTSGPG